MMAELEANAFARRIAKNAPLAVQATEPSVPEGLTMDVTVRYKSESEMSSEVFQTEDAKAGPRAFAEKRPPVWQAK